MTPQQIQERLEKGCEEEVVLFDDDSSNDFVTWKCGDQFNTDTTPYCEKCRACLSQHKESILAERQRILAVLKENLEDDGVLRCEYKLLVKRIEEAKG